MGVEKFLVMVALDKFQRQVKKKHPQLGKFLFVVLDVKKHPEVAGEFQGWLELELEDGFKEKVECTKEDLENYYSIVPIKKRIKGKEMQSIIIRLNYKKKTIDIDIAFVDGSSTEFSF